jgi:hypothetical protein
MDAAKTWTKTWTPTIWCTSWTPEGSASYETMEAVQKSSAGR